MSVLKATRSAQWPLVASFTLNFNDTMLNTSGVSKDFGAATVAATNVFEVINLPPGSVVIGGDWTTETAFDTAGWDLTVGDSTTGDRYLSSTDVKGTARTPLVPTGFQNVTGLNIRISVQCDDACTTGKGTLRVEYIVEGRSSEVQAT